VLRARPRRQHCLTKVETTTGASWSQREALPDDDH
jgi:hypothetical protein